MMQNPMPSTEKTTVKTARPSGALKRDVNLLPVNENSERMARQGTVALFVLLGVLALATVAVYLPSTWLGSLQNKASAAENQAASLAHVETEFAEVVAQRKSLLEMVSNLEGITGSGLHPASINSMLSIACPEKITLTAYTLSNGELSVTGIAANDTDVAQFLVNLRAQPNTYGTSLVSDVENPDPGAVLPRLFTVTVRLTPALAPTAEATQAPATQAPATQGGDGQWH